MLLCVFVCGLLDAPGAPVSPFPFPPGPHPRRGLEGRRDVVTIEAGGHQIQSVSLSRAMAGAFITEVRAPTPATCTPQCKTGFSIACVVCHVRCGVWGVGYCVCACVCGGGACLRACAFVRLSCRVFRASWGPFESALHGYQVGLLSALGFLSVTRFH
jgi:hypothetical protein